MSSLRHRHSLRAFVAFALSALALDLVLVLPNHPAAASWKVLLLFPLELPVVLLALIVIGDGRSGRVLRIALVAFLTVITALKLADFGMYSALNRGFNPVADFPLIASLFDLLVGVVGRRVAIGAVLLTCALQALLIWVIWWATGVWSRLSRPTWFAHCAGALALVALAAVLAEVGQNKRKWSLPFEIYGTAFTARLGVERIQMVHKTASELRAFKLAVQEDPFADHSSFFDLIDRDVLVIFIESYGRTSLDTPYYADLHRATLLNAQYQLEELGLSTASTILSSPTRGGQSWLANSTFASGLWIDSQTRYGAALISGRQTLYHLAQQSGFETAAVTPQITMDWPESQFMGFDTTLAAKDLGYAGKPPNWVTMPDQFTLGAMDRLLRHAKEETPMFIQIALGTSHAPWVPVPQVIDWDDLGDGSVFDPIVDASDPPRMVWRDHDRVRAQYRLAVDYALQTVMAYAVLHAEDPPLMIVIGDHQAAGFVALDERSDVPMHIVGTKHLVEALADDQFFGPNPTLYS